MSDGKPGGTGHTRRCGGHCSPGPGAATARPGGAKAGGDGVASRGENDRKNCKRAANACPVQL